MKKQRVNTQWIFKYMVVIVVDMRQKGHKKSKDVNANWGDSIIMSCSK